MPEIGNVSNECYLASYQNMDNTNTTVAMRAVNVQTSKNVSLSAGIGGSTNFKGNNAVMFEAKAKYNFNEHFSVQGRMRNSVSTKQNTFQFRLTPGYKTNLSDKTSIYANPYVVAKYNAKQDKWSIDKAAFVGVSYQALPNLTVSGELEKYHGLEGGAGNWGVNAILSYNF